MRTSSLPLSSLGCRVVDLAHEQDALGGVLQDQNQERPVHLHLWGQAHRYHLNGGAGGRLGPDLVHVQHGAVGHLWGNQQLSPWSSWGSCVARAVGAFAYLGDLELGLLGYPREVSSI